MDIRGVLNAAIPQTVREKENAGPTEKVVKSDSTTDRDANGQMASDGGDAHKEPMSEEQLEKALAHMRALPVVKDHGLVLEVVTMNEKRFVLLKEPSGKVVRRIPEVELWDLIHVKPNEKGQILSKTA